MSGAAFGLPMPEEPPQVITITSGVSAFTGEGFCVVTVNGVPTGQLTPAQVRAMALNWLGAAEAAEQDAMVHAELVEAVGLDTDTAGRFIAALRQRRKP